LQLPQASASLLNGAYAVLLLALATDYVPSFDHFYKSTCYHYLLLLVFSYIRSDWATYKNRLLLRSQQVANSPEIIRRLGIIAMNTPLEVDIVSSIFVVVFCSIIRV